MHTQTSCLCICTATCTLKPFTYFCPISFFAVFDSCQDVCSHLFCTDFKKTLESCPKKVSNVVTFVGNVNISGPQIRGKKLYRYCFLDQNGIQFDLRNIEVSFHI